MPRSGTGCQRRKRLADHGLSGFRLSPTHSIPCAGQAAYDAIAATLPLGSVGYEVQRSETGKVFIWLERRALGRLEAERRRGEDFSDTIIRLAAAERG